MFVLPDVCLDVSNQRRATLREERRGSEDFSGGNGKTKKVAPLMGLASRDRRQEERRRSLSLLRPQRFVHLRMCRDKKKTHLWRVIIALLSLSRRRSVAVSLKAPLRLALGTF